MSPRLWLAALAGLALLCAGVTLLAERASTALFTRAGGPIDTGPIPAGLTGVAPKDCAECHGEIAAEWAQSLHARSFTDPVFRSEYAISPEPFCVHCHAPLVPDRPGGELEGGDSELASRGVDCAACHVREGRVVARRGEGGDSHPVLIDPRLGTSEFCGGCHQFDFPDQSQTARVRYEPGLPLQDTLEEWKQSRAAKQGKTCQSCHMPWARRRDGRRYRSHRFLGLDNAEFMKSAVKVRVSAQRRGEVIEVRAVIAAGNIGHSFPTGDMFRRAVLTVSAGSARASLALERYFAPVVTDDGTGHRLRQVDDSRLAAPGAGKPLQATWKLKAPGATELVWSLELHRMDRKAARRRNLPDRLVVVPIDRGTVRIFRDR